MKKGTIADEKWNYTINIRIRCQDPENIIDVLYRSLSPLSQELRFHRGRCRIEIQSKDLLINGYAKDITSLRSVINGLLKCLYLAYVVASGELE